MEKLKQYVDGGIVELAKLDSQNQPQKVPYSELAGQVNRQEKNVALYKTLASLTWDEKYQWVSFKRLKARQRYQEGLYDEAIDIYLQSLVGIDLNDNTENRVEQMRNELQYPITLNIITCLYMKKQNKRALALCDKLLAECPKYLPAIYKKVYLLKLVGQYTQAKELLTQGIKIAKEAKQQAHLKSFIQLYGQLMKIAKDNKSVYAKMFNGERDLVLGQEKQSETQTLISQENGSSKQDDVLYFQQDGICARIHKKIKCLMHYLVPSLNPEQDRKKKQLKGKARSF